MADGWIGSVAELLAPGWRKRPWRSGPCAACGRMVLTEVRARSGVILDPEPTDDGTCVIDDHGRAITPAVTTDVMGRIPLWRAHFYSCPHRLCASAS